MTVRSQEGRIILEGRCGVEDAESLLGALQQSPHADVELEAAENLHTAVVQVLLAIAPSLRGTSKHGFLVRYGVLDQLPRAP